LVLEVGEKEQFLSRTMAGAPTSGERVAEHLLDGQQRLTALWRSMTNDYPDRTYFVEVRSDEGEPDEQSEPPRATSFGRWQKDGKLYPLWANEPRSVWDRGLIPVELLRPDTQGEEAFKKWARQAAGDDHEVLIQLIELGSNLRGRFARFNFPFLSLPASTSKETALDVFVRMNTSAQPLTTFDVVVAQVEAATNVSLHERVAELRKVAPTLDAYSDLSQVVLNAAALLQNRETSKGLMLSETFADGLVKAWDQILVGARRTARFLDEEHIFDSARLPSDAVIPVLVALWAHAPDGLDAEGEARRILRKFLWRGFFTSRYERGTNSRTLADYRPLVEILEGRDSGPPPIFNESLPTVDDLMLASWPKKRDRLARAILLVTLRSGGLDLADGSPACRESLQAREYHHIFPVSILEERGVNSSQIYRALNCALVTWRTNRAIAAKSPIEYIRHRVDASTLGEHEIRRRLSSHQIDYDVLTKGDYDAFLRHRAERVLSEIRPLCS
jgi:hypothetical protein